MPAVLLTAVLILDLDRNQAFPLLVAQVWTMPIVSTVWLCGSRLHWAMVSELWRRAIGQHGRVQSSHLETILVSAGT